MLSGGPLSSVPLSDDAGQLDAGTGWFSRDYFGVSAGFFATDYFMGDGDGGGAPSSGSAGPDVIIHRLSIRIGV